MKKIAVVEDNPDNRLLLRAILGGRYEVAEYENGTAACEGLREQIPDLVLLDISLPDMDGLDVLRQIRADAALKTVPVIALTAHDMPSDRGKFTAAGFDDYLTKPILDESVLLEAVESCLGRRPDRA
ncbi:MAG: response regulator [Verrucomicrobia bacterium]|nr:response regulator [Verrucomicrobiota bacterium]